MRAASLGVSVLLLGGCDSLRWFKERYTGVKERISYYAPVLSPDGEQVAYLKRQMRFSIGAGNLWGGGDLRFARDELLLCTSSRGRRRERCGALWVLYADHEPVQPP
jgi:hypothetical protein